MSDVVQRLRDRVHDSHMDNERLMDEAAAEIERLRARLEIDPRAPAYDGIACRDETIRQQDKLLDRFRAEVDRLRGLIDAHNADCIAACKYKRENGNCLTYTEGGHVCVTCPQDDIIETARKEHAR